jgi:hypothetical protein
MKRVLVLAIAAAALAALAVVRSIDPSMPLLWRTPRTSYGAPDLQGVWGNNADPSITRAPSLIVDPADGQFPPLTAEAKALRAAAIAKRPSGGPQDRTLAERCISSGAPYTGANHNSYTQIIQSPDTVVLLQEVIHDARIVPMTGRPHLPKQIRQLHGDSRGRWDGDTLVVETTNYLNGFQGSTPDVTITERYTRVGPDLIHWRITVNDPATWTKPFTVLIPLKREDTPIYEYACHEGNYPTLELLLDVNRSKAEGEK